jgi:hypothetical protein
MRPSSLYRVASILLVLFAIGHTLGFSHVDPKWGVDSTVRAMQSIHFDVQGFERTYWDFYLGFGLFVSVLMLFAAVLAWDLGGLPNEVLSSMAITRWGLSASFAIVVCLTLRYFFLVPLTFAILIFLCLLAAGIKAGATR